MIKLDDYKNFYIIFIFLVKMSSIIISCWKINNKKGGEGGVYDIYVLITTVFALLERYFPFSPAIIVI